MDSHGTSLYREKKKKGDVWSFRYRDNGINRKVPIGVCSLMTKKEAREACEKLREKNNRENNCPRTVADLVAHYRKHELPKKAYSTREAYDTYLDLWILPKWGNKLYDSIKTMQVEEWLGTIERPNGTKSKIRNIMSALWTHAQRHEFSDKNPIAFVRQSAKRESTAPVLTAEETIALMRELQDPCHTAVFLAACTGLRISELFALKWEDVRFDLGEIHPVRGIVDNHVGDLKTDASGRAIPIDAALASILMDWRGRCPYNQDRDYLFASPDMKVTQPYWPDTMLHKKIKPAAKCAGISKVVGWASFRSTYATLLHANSESIKTTQDLMRHANSTVTMDFYAQSIPAERRAAQAKVTAGFLGNN